MGKRKMSAERKSGGTAWLKKAKPFARGAFARVYRKNAYYPKSSFFFFGRGDIVKVYRAGSKSGDTAALNFWMMKIAHELFPENVPKVSAYVKTKTTEELHLEEVPVHKELNDYQKRLLKEKKRSHLLKSKEYKACERAFAESLPAITKIQNLMLRAGIQPKLENVTNVALAKPSNPVFLELRVYSPTALMLFIQKLPQQKRERLTRFVYRLDEASKNAGRTSYAY